MDGSSLGDRLADRPESAEEGIGIRQEVLDKESREGQFRPSYKPKDYEESIFSFGDHLTCIRASNVYQLRLFQ